MNIKDAIRQVFPTGTLDWTIGVEDGEEQKQPLGEGEEACHGLPGDPIDLFAIVAHLLSRSGAYHHVQPETEPKADGDVRRLIVTTEDRKLWSMLGRQWAETISNESGSPHQLRLVAPEPVHQLWADLVSAFDSDLFHPLDRSAQCPSWWRSALALLVIADEAALDAGFLAEAELHGREPDLLNLAVERRIRDALLDKPDGEGFGAYTLSEANADIACILPKCRTPSLGCTMRSLSHNLAFLPPRGLARARWLSPGRDFMKPDGVSPLNLLLIPFPYAVPAHAFRAAGRAQSDAASAWGWFGVEPEPGNADDAEELLTFILALIKEAERDVGRVHGLVFPELALSGPFYQRLSEVLRQTAGIEFIATGLHSEVDGTPGNYATAAIIPAGQAEGTPRVAVGDTRQKHHRWRLDAQQIATYSLGTVLDVNCLWWEQLDILSRSMTLGVLRGETTITTLICEDLARVDPVQELLRAIGPNIVIALLMDSAQLVTRWPSRYATVLAEDPGSSVLTFTSLGLIQRVNDAGFHHSRCIALWRDDQGVRELALPQGKHALCVTLSPVRIEEGTLDGRTDCRNALTWRLSGVQPVVGLTAPPAWKLFSPESCAESIRKGDSA